jgi:hypothetical protein
LSYHFAGCIDDRDFTPGVPILDNIVDAIHSSYKVILVLTDHFVSSQWCHYEADQAIIRSLGLNDVEDQDRNITPDSTFVPDWNSICGVMVSVLVPIGSNQRLSNWDLLLLC